MDLLEIFGQTNEAKRELRDGEYRNDADGLIYCSRCRTPKQHRLTDPETGKSVGIVRIQCKCEQEEQESILSDLENNNRIYEIEKNRRRAFADDSMRNNTFERADRTDSKLFNSLENYCKHFDRFSTKGQGLTLWGKCGTGKTFAACCVANRLIDEGKRVIVTSFTDIVNELQSTFEKKAILDRLKGCDLLVLDDLASERDTAFMNETIFSIIDARYRSGKPMLVTTNMTIQQMENPTDLQKQRYLDRICEVCFPIKVETENKRRIAKIHNEMDMRELLEGEQR